MLSTIIATRTAVLNDEFSSVRRIGPLAVEEKLCQEKR